MSKEIPFKRLQLQHLNECAVNRKPDVMPYDSMGFFAIRVSVRLSDRPLHREEQNNFIKNCPQLGLKPGLSGSLL